ncbi:HlyD family efflux transporter periplasmic adaptor subunit [Hyphomonas sp.]|uniref:HlyD family secretion protein n=1 Tax=Hyphomonas sp. TaxID=87 RepID=UPI0032D94DA4
MSEGLFRQEALDYQGASGTQFGAPASVLPPSWSRVTLLLALFLAALLVFLFSVDFARKETVRGRLRVDGPEAKVFALEAGIIHEVFVEDGQVVAKGDPIAEIRSERFMADGGALSAATLDELEHERSILEQQKLSIHNAANLSRQSAIQAYENALRRETESLAQLQIIDERLGVAQQRRDDIAELKDRGLIAEPVYNERREAVVTLKQSRLEVTSQMLDARSEQVRAQTEMRRVETISVRDISQLDQRISQIETESSRTEANAGHVVLAQSSGRITALQARKGEQARPDTPLAIVLPVNAKLFAEVFIPSRAIGFAEPGQIVKLQYDAFPYQKFGVAYGEVSAVATAAQTPQEVGVMSKTGEMLYRVDIAINDQSVNAYSREFLLQSGMELSADIVLENRKLVEWLMEPMRSIR